MKMKRTVSLVFFLVLTLGLRSSLHSQTTGGLLPWLPPNFFNNAGGPAANGRVCFTNSGTSIPLSVFSDKNLTSTLPNPIHLTALGIPQTGGGASTAIYLQPGFTYRVTLYANGTGNTCN